MVSPVPDGQLDAEAVKCIFICKGGYDYAQHSGNAHVQRLNASHLPKVQPERYEEMLNIELGKPSKGWVGGKSDLCYAHETPLVYPSNTAKRGGLVAQLSKA